MGMKALVFFKNQTPWVYLKKKMLGTEVSISLLLSTDGKRTVKKSYPQQIISCWIIKLEKLEAALALGLFPFSHTKMES